MKIIYLIAVYLITNKIDAQNYIGESYDYVVKRTEYLSTHNKTFATQITKEPNSIHVLVSGFDKEEIEYGFEDSICTNINMKFSCEGCFTEKHKKSILMGQWRIDPSGNYHSFRKQATLRIQQIEDPVYCIMLNVIKSAITKTEYKGLKKSI